MGGAPAVDVVAPGVGAGLDRAIEVVAVFVGETAPATAEIWINGSDVSVIAVAIATSGVGLPDLDKRAGDGAAVLVLDVAVYDDAFANGVAGFGVIFDQVVVERPEVVWSKCWTGHF